MRKAGIFVVFYFLFSLLSFADEFTYNSKGKRDPFIPLVGPGSVQQRKGVEEIMDAEDVILDGIVYDEKNGSFAIMNGTIVKEGTEAGMLKVKKIAPKKVVFLFEGREYTLALGEKKE